MEIRRRIGLPKSQFHVMNRGARKISIFADEADRRIFKGLLGRFALKYSVKIFAWCLMPNHYHLQPESEGTPLSLMMRDLDGNYARAFNYRHQTSGCLFQGPFKSMLIQDSEGLAYVNRYIHLNPIDLGQSPGSYPWSSCGAYLGLTKAPPWLDLEPVSRILRTPGRQDPESYAFYLDAGQSRPRRRKKVRDPAEDFYCGWIQHLEEKCIERMIGREHLLGRMSASTLVSWAAHRKYGVPARVIADFFGFGSAGTVRAMSARVQKKLSEDPALDAAVQSVTISATQKR